MLSTTLEKQLIIKDMELKRKYVESMQQDM